MSAPRTLAGRPGAAGGASRQATADWLDPSERALVRTATALLEAVVGGDLDAAGEARSRLIGLVTSADRIEAHRGRDAAAGLLAELFDSLLDADDPASGLRLTIMGEATRLAGALRSTELARVVAGHAAVAASRAPAATLLAAADCLAWLPAVPGMTPRDVRLRCDLLLAETLSYLALGDRTAARRRLEDARIVAPRDRLAVLAAIDAELGRG